MISFLVLLLKKRIKKCFIEAFFIFLDKSVSEKPDKFALTNQLIEKSRNPVSKDELWTCWVILRDLIQIIWEDNRFSAAAYQLISQADRFTYLLEYFWFDKPLQEKLYSFTDYQRLNRLLMSDGVYFPELTESQQAQKWLGYACSGLLDSLKTSTQLTFLNGTQADFFKALERLINSIKEETITETKSELE